MLLELAVGLGVLSRSLLWARDADSSSDICATTVHGGLLLEAPPALGAPSPGSYALDWEYGGDAPVAAPSAPLQSRLYLPEERDATFWAGWAIGAALSYMLFHALPRCWLERRRRAAACVARRVGDRIELLTRRQASSQGSEWVVLSERLDTKHKAHDWAERYLDHMMKGGVFVAASVVVNHVPGG
jgi:hypothetical protein